MTPRDQAENLRQQVADSWTEEKNTRRFVLINKEIDWQLSDDETRELQHLQEQMRAHCHKLAPLPIAEAKALHDKLKALHADASTEGPEDEETYAALKVSVGRITRMAMDLLYLSQNDAVTPYGVECQAVAVDGYLRDVCGHHDIEIPEDSE